MLLRHPSISDQIYSNPPLQRHPRSEKCLTSCTAFCRADPDEKYRRIANEPINEGPGETLLRNKLQTSERAKHESTRLGPVKRVLFIWIQAPCTTATTVQYIIRNIRLSFSISPRVSIPPRPGWNIHASRQSVVCAVLNGLRTIWYRERTIGQKYRFRLVTRCPLEFFRSELSREWSEFWLRDGRRDGWSFFWKLVVFLK